MIRYSNDVNLEVSLLGRTAARLARQVEAGLASLDLSLPQYRILTLLGEGSAAASALADRLAVTRPSVTAVVDGLVSRGLVERRADPEDRRRVRHSLTELGQSILERADGAVDARLHEILGLLGDGKAAQEAFRGLDRWRQALDALRESHEAAHSGGGVVG